MRNSGHSMFSLHLSEGSKDLCPCFHVFEFHFQFQISLINVTFKNGGIFVTKVASFGSVVLLNGSLIVIFLFFFF